jgi:hypothetical protein
MQFGKTLTQVSPLAAWLGRSPDSISTKSSSYVTTHGRTDRRGVRERGTSVTLRMPCRDVHAKWNRLLGVPRQRLRDQSPPCMFF